LNDLITGDLDIKGGGGLENYTAMKKLVDGAIADLEKAYGPSCSAVAWLKDVKNVLDQNLIVSNDKATVAGFNALIGKRFEDMSANLGKDSELGMISLQSIMSQRQSAIQICTNLVQSFGDQMNKIAANIGH
jgi:hypothetical protein